MHLKRGEKLTPLQALEKVRLRMRLAARIKDLRDAGDEINTTLTRTQGAGWRGTANGNEKDNHRPRRLRHIQCRIGAADDKATGVKRSVRLVEESSRRLGKEGNYRRSRRWYKGAGEIRQMYEMVESGTLPWWLAEKAGLV